MALKYMEYAPGSPFVLAGQGNVPIGNLPMPTSKALLAMADNSVPVTALWGGIFHGFLKNPNAIPQDLMQRLNTRRSDDPVAYTIEFSGTHLEAIIRFFV